MIEAWPRIPVGDLVRKGEAFLQTGPFGTQLSASEYVREGIPVINVRNVGFGEVRDDDLEYVSESKAEQLHYHILRKGDIVFGRKGAVERHALIGDGEDGWVQGSDCLQLRLRSQRFNERFVSFYLRTQAHQEWMQALCAFGATMNSLNQDIVNRIQLPCPPLPVQNHIAAILAAYDDLIANNQRRIDLKESMAEEIYREWFVRMRFPGHSTVAMIAGYPRDWEPVRVEKMVRRLPFGRVFHESETNPCGEVEVIDQSRKLRLGFHDGSPQHLATENKPIVLFGDHTCKMRLMTKPFSLAENVIPFVPNDGRSALLLYHLIKDLIRTTEYKRHWTDLIKKDVLSPSRDLELSFERLVLPLHKQSQYLVAQTELLERTRDALLPRLISGKLRVDQLDIRYPPSMIAAQERLAKKAA